MRELVIAAVGAMLIIAIGLATMNSGDRRSADELAAIGKDNMTASLAMRLAD